MDIIRAANALSAERFPQTVGWSMRAMIFPAWLLAGLLSANTHAEAWCSVQPEAVKPFVDSLVARLKPLMGTAASPVTHVHTEGTLPGHGIRDASESAETQLSTMRDAALAWREGAGDSYLVLARRYLSAWISTYQPDLNPIDETPFDGLIDTYAIVQKHLDPTTDAAARKFLHDWATGYVTVMDQAARTHGSVSGSWTNNWQSHRVKLVSMIAVALNDPLLFADARRLFRAQIAVNIRPDGEVVDFGERDALHYVIYDLKPLVQAALAARTRGEDWFHDRSPTGSSLAQAFQWLEPYASGKKLHTEFVHSKVAFDAERAAAGVKGYAGPFEPKTAGDVFWMASVFDPVYSLLAKRLKHVPPSFLLFCGT